MPGCEPIQGLREDFQAGQRRTLSTSNGLPTMEPRAPAKDPAVNCQVIAGYGQG